MAQERHRRLTLEALDERPCTALGTGLDCSPIAHIDHDGAVACDELGSSYQHFPERSRNGLTWAETAAAAKLDAQHCCPEMVENLKGDHAQESNETRDPQLAPS